MRLCFVAKKRKEQVICYRNQFSILNDSRRDSVIWIVGANESSATYTRSPIYLQIYTNTHSFCVFIFKRFVYIFSHRRHCNEPVPELKRNVRSQNKTKKKKESEQPCFSRMISHTISFYPWCMDLFFFSGFPFRFYSHHAKFSVPFFISSHRLFLFHVMFSRVYICSFAGSVWPVCMLLPLFTFLFVWFFPESLVICSGECVESGIWILLWYLWIVKKT